MSDFWSLEDRVMYLFHTNAFESQEFLTWLTLYGKPKIHEIYLKYKALGSDYVPKSPTSFIHPKKDSITTHQTPKTAQKKEETRYSRFHPRNPNDDF